MKKLFVLFCILFNTLMSQAQLGDFSLDSNNTLQRRFQKAPANPELRGGPLKNLFIGKNYRKEWLEPVTAPVINLKTDLGGLTPKEEGGGKQTRSLKLEDKDGLNWALRSIKKFPEKVVLPELKGTIAEKIIRDGISGSYPYSTLSVGTFANAAGLKYLPNTLVYIPDDPALGEFRNDYKNSLSLLELRSVLGNDGKELETSGTDKIVRRIQKTNKNIVDQRKVLQVRLLDNFLMDFDRHEDQWEWVEIDSSGKTFYYPVGKDRDQVFFDIKGLIPKIAQFFQPALGVFQGVREKARNIATFNHTARDFDRTFLSELEEDVWSREIDAFLAAMTDSVIETALRKQPIEVHKYSVDDLIKTLKGKRKYFKEDMMKYYRFLSETVSVAGSNDPEHFSISKNNDGSLLITVQSLDSTGSVSGTIYRRSFNPSVTKELRIYGLEGNDKFLITGGDSPIKIRMIGGPGKDNFINEGNGGDLLVYDVSFEDNSVLGNKGIKNKINDDPFNNEYRRLGTQYNFWIPGIAIELTREGGLFLGPTFKTTIAGFRKEPYASMHSFYAARALNSASYHFKYDADFIKLFNNTDLLIRTDATLPTVRTYFFGLGNNSNYNQSIGFPYYLARYSHADVSVLARNHITPWLQIKYGPLLQYFRLDDDKNIGTYVRSIYPNGSNNLYKGLTFTGGEISAEVNTRNHALFTTQGIHANVYTRGLVGIGDNTNRMGQVGGAISLFSDFLYRRMIILATSFGAHHNINDFEFPQAQYLGFRQNLRGYRFQRFAGRTRAYNNSEIRLNLGVKNFYFFKGFVGLLGFHDVGRVWVEGETSDVWHTGYGGGVWVAPFNKLIINTTISTSKEEKKWLQVTFGFQF